jgi:hypothetical protein
LWRSFAAAALAFSCGYAPVRSRATAGVRVAPVRNDTAQADVGGILAAELRNELLDRKQLEPESSPAPELRAQILSLVSVPTSAGALSAATYRLNALVHFTAGDWDDTVGAGEDYLAGVDVLGTEANRRAALRRLFRALAKDAIDRWSVSSRIQ